MSASNELNDLVNHGKDDIQKFVKLYLHLSLAGGTESEKRAAMTVSSLLSLAVRKTQPVIDIQHIRTLIIEENLAVLAELPEHDPRVLRLFALATGRATQAREFIHALGRIGQTYLDDAAAIAAYIVKMEHALTGLERAAVRMFPDASGKPVLLDLGNLLQRAGDEARRHKSAELLEPVH